MNGKKIVLAVGIALLFSFPIYFLLGRKAIKSSEKSSSKKQTNPLAESTSEKSQAALFLMENVRFSDSIDGLIGTVKGNTIELAFGSQEEKLTAIHVEVGQLVERGQNLFDLDHTRAESRKNQAEIALNRIQQLQAVGGSTLQDLREAQSAFEIAKKDYEETFISAPARGFISEINKEIGETVNRNEVIAVLVSVESRFYITTGVIESDIAQVFDGQKVLIEIGSLGNFKVTGTVRGVSHEVTTTGRIGTVHIHLPDYVQPRLRPGLSAQCKIMIFDQETLVIPRQAYDQTREGVYAMGADGKAVFKSVQLGRLTRDYYQVRGGLKMGEKIVADLTNNPIMEGTALTDTGEYVRYPSSKEKEKS